MILLTLITVLAGINKVISSISLVAPVLVATVVVISILTISQNLPVLLANLSWSLVPRAAVPFWLLAALLYVSYNLILSIAVLAPLGARSRSENLLPGALLGGLGLGGGLWLLSWHCSPLSLRQLP